MSNHNRPRHNFFVMRNAAKATTSLTQCRRLRINRKFIFLTELCIRDNDEYMWVGNCPMRQHPNPGPAPVGGSVLAICAGEGW